MEPKKNPKVDLEKKRGLFMQIGLALSLLIVLGAFEYRSYEKVIASLGDLVLDAYCGVGTISLLISKKVHKVFGVDNIKEAIEDAKVNSKLNGSSNCEFICEKASIYLENSKIKFNSIIVDPPRDGLKSNFINALIINLPEKILYISCEPSSLARDLKQLKKYYIISKVLPVDMFSQTYHVETITLLMRK